MFCNQILHSTSGEQASQEMLTPLHARGHACKVTKQTGSAVPCPTADSMAYMVARHHLVNESHAWALALYRLQALH
jgi:hypothetical protein